MFIPGRSPLDMILNHAILSMAMDIKENGPYEFNGLNLLLNLDQQWGNPFLTALALRTAKEKGFLSTRPCDCNPDCANHKVSITQAGMEEAERLLLQVEEINKKIETKWGALPQVEQAVVDGTITMQEIVDYVYPADPTESPPVDVGGAVVLNLQEPDAGGQDRELDELARAITLRRQQSGSWGVNDPNQN